MVEPSPERTTTTPFAGRGGFFSTPQEASASIRAGRVITADVSLSDLPGAVPLSESISRQRREASVAQAQVAKETGVGTTKTAQQIVVLGTSKRREELQKATPEQLRLFREFIEQEKRESPGFLEQRSQVEREMRRRPEETRPVETVAPPPSVGEPRFIGVTTRDIFIEQFRDITGGRTPSASQVARFQRGETVNVGEFLLRRDEDAVTLTSVRTGGETRRDFVIRQVREQTDSTPTANQLSRLLKGQGVTIKGKFFKLSDAGLEVSTTRGVPVQPLPFGEFVTRAAPEGQPLLITPTEFFEPTTPDIFAVPKTPEELFPLITVLGRIEPTKPLTVSERVFLEASLAGGKISREFEKAIPKAARVTGRAAEISPLFPGESVQRRATLGFKEQFAELTKDVGTTVFVTERVGEQIVKDIARREPVKAVPAAKDVLGVVPKAVKTIPTLTAEDIAVGAGLAAGTGIAFGIGAVRKVKEDPAGAVGEAVGFTAGAILLGKGVGRARRIKTPKIKAPKIPKKVGATFEELGGFPKQPRGIDIPLIEQRAIEKEIGRQARRQASLIAKAEQKQLSKFLSRAEKEAISKTVPKVPTPRVEIVGKPRKFELPEGFVLTEFGVEKAFKPPPLTSKARKLLLETPGGRVALKEFFREEVGAFPRQRLIQRQASRQVLRPPKQPRISTFKPGKFDFPQRIPSQTIIRAGTQTPVTFRPLKPVSAEMIAPQVLQRDLPLAVFLPELGIEERAIIGERPRDITTEIEKIKFDFPQEIKAPPIERLLPREVVSFRPREKQAVSDVVAEIEKQKPITIPDTFIPTGPMIKIPKEPPPKRPPPEKEIIPFDIEIPPPEIPPPRRPPPEKLIPRRPPPTIIVPKFERQPRRRRVVSPDIFARRIPKPVGGVEAIFGFRPIRPLEDDDFLGLPKKKRRKRARKKKKKKTRR